jgi:predicted phosphodiesterase
MKIVALSDTHGRHFGLNVPDGDVVVHCGDLCSHGNMATKYSLRAIMIGSLKKNRGQLK